jgi:crotonobetainyl-CoA:carnitine CoA-transferase CaiB-like acyl-CoA transferase
MLASNLYLCSEDALRYPNKPDLPLPDGDLRGTGALHRLYRSADGWVFVSCASQEEWQLLCAALKRSELSLESRFADAESRRRFDDQLIAELASALSLKTADEWEEIGFATGAAIVRADGESSDDFFLSHAQSVDNQFVVQVEHPGMGIYRRAACGVRFSRTPATARASHEFGQDGRAILTELGYDDMTISKWSSSGVLVLSEVS